jgi:hypothetical protein
MFGSLIEIEGFYGMEMSMEKAKIIRISREQSRIQL